MKIVFPMDRLTVNTGKKRKLITAPKHAVNREWITPNKDGTYAVNPKGIKIPAGKYFLETKEQGHFHYYARNVNGDYSMFGKRETVNGGYRDIWPLVKKGLTGKLPSLPNETAIAIELVWEGHQDSQVPTAIKNCPEELTAIGLGVAIYKGEIIAGTKKGYMQGRRILKRYFKENVVKFQGILDIIGDSRLDAKNIELWLDVAKREELEGFVAKSYHYDGWYKLKGIQECDVFVTGFKISTSNTYYGEVTSLLLSMMDGDKICPVGSASGFDDLMKSELTHAYKTYGETPENTFMYRVCRVTYQEVGTAGGIKHGFFDGWREDKNPLDCQLDQLK